MSDFAITMVAICVTVGTLAGIALYRGWRPVYDADCKKLLIEADLAQYNPKTGVFELKKKKKDES